MRDERDIAAVLAELRELSVRELIARYEEVFGKPPRVRYRDHLWRRIAWRVQADRYGGLSQVAQRRIDELIGTLDLPFGKGQKPAAVPVHSGDGEPPLGTALVRTWRGREYVATRTEQGWACAGVVYRSLTAAARAITGSAWNGRLFFGLTTRKERRA